MFLRTLTASAIVVPLLLLTAACGSDPTPDLVAEHTADRSLVDDTPGLVTPGAVHVDRSLDHERAAHLVRTAQRLYTFWDTGRARYLDQAISPGFRDRTLPAGRPQGPSGPVTASREFRTAIPDLTCELADLYVVGDTFTARLVFRGHFTGIYDGVDGAGQPIEFGALDIQHLGDGRLITEDWHLEDNLTFLQQAGLA